MVGAFPPFIKRIQEITKNFLSLKKPRAVGKGDAIQIEPEARLLELIPNGDILIITGVTLVNHTLEPILRLARKHVKLSLSSLLRVSTQNLFLKEV